MAGSSSSRYSRSDDDLTDDSDEETEEVISSDDDDNDDSDTEEEYTTSSSDDVDFYERQRCRKKRRKERGEKSRNRWSRCALADDLYAEKKKQISCKICMEQKAYQKIYRNETCSCRQSYCSQCIGKHIVAKIQENISSVRCPSMICQGVLKPQLCEKIISKQVLDRWNVILRKNSLVSAGLKCQEDLKIMELAKKKKWQRCFGCKIYVEKRDGCLHITCRCGVEFCYRCGAKWTSIHHCS